MSCGYREKLHVPGQLPRSPTDEQPGHVLDAEQISGVVDSHRAAVEQSRCPAAVFVPEAGERLLQFGDGGRAAVLAYRPDGFVGNEDTLQLRCGETVECPCRLLEDESRGSTGLV